MHSNFIYAGILIAYYNIYIRVIMDRIFTYGRERTQFEEIAGIFSTWIFILLMALFNIPIFSTVVIKYGVYFASPSVGDSYYTLLLALVSVYALHSFRVSLLSFAKLCLSLIKLQPKSFWDTKTMITYVSHLSI